MTGLASGLAALIQAHGPITVEQFIHHALYDKAEGYYSHRDPLGAAGDFITAPEISQMFGELIGLWCAERWLAGGQPAAVQLVELGPGRGSLMADLRRATATVPGFQAAAQIHLVETSAKLRAAQARQVPDAHWHHQFADTPPGYSLIIANEFFDALPVRQFVRTGKGWRERCVTLVDGAFAPCAPADGADAESLIPHHLRNAPQGAVFERNTVSENIVAGIAARLQRHGGWALIADYGHAQPALGETLQALRGHSPAPVFQAPGQHDLTAHVDFTALTLVAQQAGAAVFGPVGQGVFLERMGISARAERLKCAANPRSRAEIAAAHLRLTAPAQMGTLFKMLALGPAGAPAPPGFAPWPEESS